MNTPNDTNNQIRPPQKSGYYELCIKGQLSPQIAGWFEDMTVTVNEETVPPQTIIRGYIVDQAALYGLIDRARDLGLTLLSVKCLEETEDGEPQTLEGDAYDDNENSQPAEDTLSI